MNLTSVLLRDGRNLGGIIPDVVVEEVHTDTLTITEHPVEQGAAITDHAFKNPAQLRLVVGWSPSSLALGDVIEGFVSGTLLTQGIRSTRDLYEQLLALQASRQPFEVSTGKRLYENMLIESLQTSTDSSTADALVVSVSLREVIIVQTRAAKLKAEAQAEPQKTAPPVQRGNVATVPTDLDVLRASGGPR